MKKNKLFTRDEINIIENSIKVHSRRLAKKMNIDLLDKNITENILAKKIFDELLKNDIKMRSMSCLNEIITINFEKSNDKQKFIDIYNI